MSTTRNNIRYSARVILFFASAFVVCLQARAQTSVESPSADPTFLLGVPAEIRTATEVDQNLEPKTPQWIWSSDPQNHHRVTFQRELATTGLITQAQMWITVDDSFVLSVNDIEVDRSKSTWHQVTSIDLLPWLKPNQKNVITVVAKNSETHHRGVAGLLAMIQWTDSGGTKQVLSGRGWMANTGLGFERASPVAPLLGNPWRSEGGLQGWPGYDQGDEFYLRHLQIAPVAVEILSGNESEFRNLNSLVHPTTDPHPSFTVIFGENQKSREPLKILLDFGKELSGSLELMADSGVGIEVATGESREEATIDPWTPESRLDLKPGISQHSTETGFRFVQLTFYPQNSQAHEIHFSQVFANFVYYPVQYQGSFESSDPLLNKIWHTGAYTTHLCMQQDIWDAPKRDRKRWMGDMMVSGDVINNVFGDSFLLEQTLTRLRLESQGSADETAIPAKHVNDGPPGTFGLPGYSYAWINQLASFHRHRGDASYLMQQHDLLLSMLKLIEKDLDQKGVFVNGVNGWNFVDWSPGFDNDSPQARMATHLFMIKALNEAAFLLGEMNDTANAKKIDAFAKRERAIAQHTFQSPERRTFGKYRHTNALAIFAGVAEPQEWESIYRETLDPQTQDQTFMTPYFLNYVIYAQSMAGHTREALSYIKKYWGAMLDLGSSTWFELFDLSWPKEQFHYRMAFRMPGTENSLFVSLSHAWSAGPTNWLTERVLGIRPTGAGFTTVDIDPDLGDLKWARGAVPTPRGLLSVAVESLGSAHRQITLTLPTGTTARVYHGQQFETITSPGVRTIVQSLNENSFK